MKYAYACDCGNRFEKDYPMGRASKNAKCKCGKKAHRDYSFGVRISDPVSDAREGRGQG